MNFIVHSSLSHFFILIQVPMTVHNLFICQHFGCLNAYIANETDAKLSKELLCYLEFENHHQCVET